MVNSLPPHDSTAVLAAHLSDKVAALGFDKQPSRSSFYRGASYKIHDGDFARPEGTPLDEGFKKLLGKGTLSEQIKIHDSRIKDIETSMHKAMQTSSYIHWFAATAARQLPNLQEDSLPTDSSSIPNSALHTAFALFDSLGDAVLDLDKHLLWMNAQLTLLRRTSYIKQLPQNIDPRIKDRLYSAPLFGKHLFGPRVDEALKERDLDLERKRSEDIHNLAMAASPRRPRGQTSQSPRTPSRRYNQSRGFTTPKKQDKSPAPSRGGRGRGRGQRRV